MKPTVETEHCQLWLGDCRTILNGFPEQHFNCCVTSPPYFGLRDYGVDGQIGLEPTPEEYVGEMVNVFREVWRVLRDDGTLWLNLGDSYNAQPGQRKATDVSNSPKQKTNQGSIRIGSRSSHGLEPKNLIGIPWRVAFALQAEGWILRSDIIWHKPNAMPESVTDRPTKGHEYLFLFAKSQRYYYDAEAIAEPSGGFNGSKFEDGKNVAIHSNVGMKTRSGNIERKPATERGCLRDGVAGSIPWEGSTRNRRTVWSISSQPFSGAHFATFPPKLVEPCILAGCLEGGTVIDPFAGSGTTLAVAAQYGRRGIGIELNPDYISLALGRIEEAEKHVREFNCVGSLFDPSAKKSVDMFAEVE